MSNYKKRLCCDIDEDTFYIIKYYCDMKNLKFSGFVNALLDYGIYKLTKTDEFQQIISRIEKENNI